MSTGWTTHTNVATTVYAANSKNPKRKESVMNINVPGLTPEMCQARADYLRRQNYDLKYLRQDVPSISRSTCLLDAALLEQYPARPELRVGDLAKFDSGPLSRVDYIGMRLVVLTDRRGVEWWTESANSLTPTGEPAPDDWGQ